MNSLDAGGFAIAAADITQPLVLAASHGCPEVGRLLEAHRFRDLFIDVLGWERAHGQKHLSHKGHEVAVTAVAHKRGFQVFHCVTDRYTVVHRSILRAVQKQIATFAHEHILIYTCDKPRRQVWQWGLRTTDGRKLRHLEHPFFSENPPPRFHALLQRLRVALDEEHALTLLDVIERVRHLLGRPADLDLFIKRPAYARQSDQLALAMKTGGVEEFQRFVLFHHRLIRWFARQWHRQMHIDEDETEQLCAIGMMRAAELFDPERGLQFATYASKSAKRTCRRLSAQIRFPIHLPQYVLSFCWNVQRLYDRVFVSEGRAAAERAVRRHLARHKKPFADAWISRNQQLARLSLSHRSDDAFREAATIPATDDAPDSPVIERDMFDGLNRVVEKLSERERTIVRAYYGYDGEPQTLQQIGDTLGITRERVRQILGELLKRLRMNLDTEPEEIGDLLRR